MSVETWKKEFYPVEAETLAKSTALKATEHSLQKWLGLRKKNLKKHDMIVGGWGDIYSDPGKNSDTASFSIDAESCALCVKFEEKDHIGENKSESCKTCPLCRVRGGVSCDTCDSGRKGEYDSPWWSWCGEKKNPEPMIRWLRRAKKMLETESAERKAKRERAKK